MIEDNLRRLKQQISDIAAGSGRRPEDVVLVCVTKEASLGQIKQVIALGVSDIGENRAQDAAEKYTALGRIARWHFIGHLQTNKVKKVIEIFDLIHSVDSFHLAEAISKEAARINKIQDILIQINASGEQSKFGVDPHETIALLRKIISLNKIRVLGFMTIAPLTGDSESIRYCFRKLKELSEELKVFLPSAKDEGRKMILSMGMSNDYQIAIEEGATMVRIGSAIFK
ncbi:MAG: YggS family pyridoxal phosphate-dependent enzyme [Candidatus Omnitrophica bacterium CG_4_9_14_0_2_um_filter_43_12]|nr:MAG: YggS family pyridoxal phosphate-dependent enzyme [Candidatus Omnitrophica bacterium CG_4_9_14_0_2_um_filter_43_12]